MHGLTLQVLPQKCISPCNAVIITMPGTVLTKDLQQKPDGTDFSIKAQDGKAKTSLACCHFRALCGAG